MRCLVNSSAVWPRPGCRADRAHGRLDRSGPAAPGTSRPVPEPEPEPEQE